MNLKNNKIIKVLALTGIVAVGVYSGYSALNKDVTLIVKGDERAVSTFKPNVKEFLEEQNVTYDGNDIVSIELDKKLVDGDKIEVIDVKEQVVKESKIVPYEVNIVEDSSLLKGSTKVDTEGKEGTNELVYKVTYHNGKKIEKTFLEEVVSVEPIDKVVKKGTKVEVQVASSRGDSIRESVSQSQSQSQASNQSSNRKHMTVVATAYTGDTITSTGTKPKWGTIAVDPSIIPYGTKVYIPQFDMTFVAEDTGGAIKGNKIDIFMPDEVKVKNWGRKTIDIYVIG